MSCLDLRIVLKLAIYVNIIKDIPTEENLGGKLYS